ncbi:GNAT family N-acetyltransferase [Saccharopolyspora sp. 5N102]|uniref:GNAT family N-acetyltransferase n=1 Tax=Saccharopolyspora sp. 5N102 TaxID=3375155 RepID=UPI0037B594BF
MIVRLATDADARQIPITLARAFSDYAFTNWTVAADDHHHRLVELYTLFVAEFGRSVDGVWVTDDCAAVASWLPPGVDGPDEAFMERNGPRMVELFGDRAKHAAAADAITEPRRPSEPHWYLASMGTHPDWQSRGLGARVLTPVLERCDAEGIPAYTDTATERNVKFYRAQGFEVIDEADVPEGGPHVWFLRRTPR